jgi:hypothetical protein
MSDMEIVFFGLGCLVGATFTSVYYDFMVVNKSIKEKVNEH